MGKIKNSIMPVTGLSCSNCALAFERSVRKLPGVQEANVSFSNEKLVISFDPELIHEKDIMECIQHIGYGGATGNIDFQINGMQDNSDELTLEKKEQSEYLVIANQSIKEEIIQLKLTEKALQVSEKEFRSLAESMPQIVWVTRADGWNTYFNQQWVDYTGLSLEESCGDGWNQPFHPDDRQRAWDEWQNAINNNGIYSMEARLRRFDGEYRWWLVRGVPQLSESGEILKWFGTCTDIEEIKRTQKTLHESEIKFRAVAELSPMAIYSSSDSDQKATYINAAFCKTFGFSREDVPTVGHWWIKAFPDEKYRQEVIDQWVYNIEQADKNNTDVDILECVCTCKDGSEKIIAWTAKTIGDEFWAFGYDFTERIQAEKALRESERFLRESQAVARLGSFAWDLSTGFWKSSAILDEIFGINEKYIRSLEGWTSIVHPDWKKIMNKYVTNEVIGKLQKFDKEYKIIRQNDSKERWVHGQAVLELDSNNQPIRMIGIISDITERKQAEEKLRESEYRFNQVSENAKELIWDVDRNGLYTYVNPIIKDLLGYEPEEIVGKKHFYDLFDQENREELIQAALEIFDQKLSFKDYVNSNQHKDGRKIILSSSAIPMLDSTGNLMGYRGVDIDITEREHAEKKLLESEEKFRAFFENSMDAILLTSPSDGKTLAANQAACNMFGYTEAELIKIGKSGIQDPTDPRLSVLLEERKLLGNVRGEVTFIRKDGTRFPAEISSSIIKKQDGFEHTSWIIRDISERKRSEKESLMLAHSLKSINECVCLTDMDNKITFINQSFLKTYGYASEELIGEHISIVLTQPDEHKLVDEILPATILGEWQGELMNRRKNGSEFPVYLSTTKVTDKDGTILGLMGISMDITAYKQALESLHEKEGSLRTAQEIAKMGSWEYDIVNNKTKWSENTYALFGLKPFEIEPRYEFFRSIIAPEDIPVLDKISEDIWISKQLVDIELRIILPDGNIKWLQNRFMPVYKNKKLIKMSGINLDITDRKNAEEKLRKLSSAVEQTVDTVVITDRDGKIEYVNRAFENKTGYSSDEALGKTPGILKSDKHPQKFYKDMWTTILSGNVFREDVINRKKDGSFYEEEKTISPLFNTSGVLTHFVGTGTDITRRKQTENELIVAKEKAEESDRLKSAFLTNMSHEIRTPMNGILGFTSLLKEPKLSGKEQQDYIKIIEKAGDRMLNIINDIVDISKIESGLTEITISTTDVNEQIEYLHSFFKPEATQKGLILNCSKLPPSYKSIIQTDKEKIYAILTNLVKNAIKYTNSGSIEFGCEIKGKFLRYFVKDTGIGIDKEKMEMVFERFRQASESHTRNYEGAGLGLSIAKAYVEILGGKIWAESKEGKGSTFYVTIPYHPEPDKMSPEKIIVLSHKPADQPRNLKILIAEDDETSEMLVRIVFSMYSQQVLEVTNGNEAVEVCRKNPDLDLILMDIKMPGIDGLAATRLIREFNKHVVIIAQTALGLSGDGEKALEAGCDDYISKPLDVGLLKDLIQKHFGK